MPIDADPRLPLQRFLQNLRSDRRHGIFSDTRAGETLESPIVERCPEPDAWFALDAAHVAHLDRCAECRAVAAMIVRAGVLDDGASDGTREGLVPELLPNGAQLGRYVVRGAIGAGGMGVVLEAYDPKLDRRVALKVVRRLRDDAGWERAKARVLAEAQAMARLAHPNVIAIHDLVEIGDEQLIAMELVDGPDLDAWIATNPPHHDRVRAVLDAARGVAAAHDAGIVHRDIKPSNILIGGDGRARVTDFGLAALAGEQAPGAVGTPGFLAPEVERGGVIDARADQYAFAVTAWRTLFDAPPGERGRGPLARALERALAADPAARWPTMHDLVRALERRSMRRFAVVAGLAAAAAVGAVWIATRSDAQACTIDRAPVDAAWSPDARAAWVARLAATPSAAVADSLAADVDRAWQQWLEASAEACGKPAHVTDCLASTQRKLLAFLAHAPASKHASAAQEALAIIPSARVCLQPANQQPIAIAAELRASRAPFKAALDEVTMLSWLGQYEQAHAKLDELLARAPTNDPALRGELLYRKADAMARTGDVAGSVAVLEEGLAIAERAGNDIARLNTIIQLLLAYEELGKTVEAKALAKVAEAAAQRVPRDPEVAARLAAVLGSLAYNTGNHADAERHYKVAVALQEEMHGPSDPTIAGALHNHGLAVHMAGRVDEAKQIQERSLAMFEATVGPDHPDTALPVTELAGIALEQNRVDDAITLYRRGLGIRERALGAKHPHLSETLLGLARAESRRGNSDAAIANLRRARELGMALGDHHPLVAATEYWLANELDRRGERDEVESLLAHALAAWEANQVAIPEAALTRFLLAQYRWRAGDRARARALAQQARTALAALAAPYAKTAEEVDAWLAKH